jgi:3',5'-cyclic AMP phosphodiesterase CpdA
MLICQLTDLHVRPPGVASSRVSETNMMVERALRVVSQFEPRPDVVVITGDLTDCGLDAEYILLADMLWRHLKMPVYVIPGNHDRRVTLREQLAHLPGVTAHPHFVQYAIDEHPVRLVMLDTVVPGAGHGELCEERLRWLDETLAARPDVPTLVGMHHPPFICGIEHMDQIALRHPERFVEVIARHRQVERVICGHHHRPIVTRLAHTICSISPGVSHQVELELRPGMPGFMVMEPAAFQLHAWSEAHGLVSHTAYVERFPGPFPFLSDPDYPGAGGPR